MKIYKYAIELADGVTGHMMPTKAKILSVGLDGNDEVCVWMLVDETLATKETRFFRIYGTGWDIHKEKIEFIGTVPMKKNYLIWHVFEVLPK